MNSRTCPRVGPWYASITARIGLLALVALVAWGIYALWESRHTPPGLAGPGPRQAQAKTGELGQGWYRNNVDYWRTLDYQPLTDTAALHALVAEWVRDRFPGPPIAEDALVRDLAQFLSALAAPNPTEYVKRLAPRRAVRTDNIYLDQPLHTWYRQVVGQPMPEGTTAPTLLDLFWKGFPGAASRPVSISRRAVLQVAEAKPLPPGGLPAGYLLFNATYPDFSMWKLMDPSDQSHWIGTFTEGFPQLTMPTVSYETVQAGNSPVPICEVHCAVRTREDVSFVVSIAMYHSADEGAWHVQWFTNYYPFPVCWPF